MSTLLGTLETEIITKLTPIVDAMTDGCVKQIVVEAFNSPEDMAGLLERNKDRMPGAYLSPPTFEYKYGQAATGGQVAVHDVTLTYNFLAGWSDRRAPVHRRESAYQFNENFMAALAFQRLPSAGIHARKLIQRVEVNRGSYIDNSELAAVFYQFVVVVNNWLINTPSV